ncbi:hydrogenase maturation nickel metallochaperone HypA [Archaeoglobus neptunius]|uniref:hydrogenase maturation nickel metallochaperone HypA n=1 Tax=Archaeoglobus neptunius TaxID=2798580 RepID=UPI00192672DD|nr:hydrogenase maturation nickel metallochaperone HypA [Archaeoglobus neptunius]
MSFAEAVVNHALRFAEEKRAKRVLSVKITVGELLMINPEQLEFCFRIASKGTLLEGAELDITVKKADIKCTVCGKELDKDVLICECGGFANVRGGKDFILDRVSLEV